MTRSRAPGAGGPLCGPHRQETEENPAGVGGAVTRTQRARPGWWGRTILSCRAGRSVQSVFNRTTRRARVCSQVAMRASSDVMRFWTTTGICIIRFGGVIAFTLIPTPGSPSNGYGPNAARLILQIQFCQYTAVPVALCPSGTVLLEQSRPVSAEVPRAAEAGAFTLCPRPRSPALCCPE